MEKRGGWNKIVADELDEREGRKRFNTKGAEISDRTPVAMPLGWKRPESIEEKMRRIIRESLSQRAMEEGFETFDESDDFDMGDEDGLPMPYSPHEMTTMQEDFVPSAPEKRRRTPADPAAPKPAPRGNTAGKENLPPLAAADTE